MFTGIIEELGEITAVDWADDAARVTVRGPLAVTGARHGDSISVSGVCLTVIDQTDELLHRRRDGRDARDEHARRGRARTSRESRARGAGRGPPRRAHRAGPHRRHRDRALDHRRERLAGGPASVSTPSTRALVVRKGSIAIDGVSLTVSAVGGGLDDGWFEVSLIPETLQATTLGDRVVGDRVNIETDILARHVERMLSLGYAAPALVTETESSRSDA